jgi:hypothetical protein
MATDDELPFDKQGNPTVNDFAGWKKEDIKDYVQNWFRWLYADPVHEMPYVDGEYLYIYGGPYDAEEVIYSAFGSCLSEDLIKEIVDEVESDGTYNWAPNSHHPAQVAAAEEAMWDREYEQWLSQHDPLSILKTAKIELEEFVASHVANEGTSFIHRMAFIQGWAILEAYLFGKIVKSVQENAAAVTALYQVNDDLKKLTFKGAAILESPDLLERTAISYLEKRAYHALDRIIPLYEQAFGKLKDADANVSKAMTMLISLTSKRHDCVHRNGQTKNNETVQISKEDIELVIDGGLKLAAELEKLVSHHEAETKKTPYNRDG